MSWESIIQEIEKRFKTEWASTTPIVYGNLPKPKSIGNQNWVRLTTQLGESQRITLGSTFYRTPGIIMVQIFTPTNESELPSMSLADTASAIWRAQQFSGISCNTPSVNRIGKVSGWNQVNVVCPFYSDENIATIASVLANMRITSNGDTRVDSSSNNRIVS